MSEKAKLEAIVVTEGDEFNLGPDEVVLSSELTSPQGSEWGLVVLRRIKDEEHTQQGSEHYHEPFPW